MAQPLRTLYRAINPANTITKRFCPQTSLRQTQPQPPQSSHLFHNSLRAYSAQTFTTKPPPGSKMRAYWYDNVEVSFNHTHPQLHLRPCSFSQELNSRSTSAQERNHRNSTELTTITGRPAPPPRLGSRSHTRAAQARRCFVQPPSIIGDC